MEDVIKEMYRLEDESFEDSSDLEDFIEDFDDLAGEAKLSIIGDYIVSRLSDRKLTKISDAFDNASNHYYDGEPLTTEGKKAYNKYIKDDEDADMLGVAASIIKAISNL